MADRPPAPRRVRGALVGLLILGATLRLLPLRGPLENIDGRTLPDDAYLTASVAQSIGWSGAPRYAGEPTNGYQPLHALLAALTWRGDPPSVRAAPALDLLDRRIKQQVLIAVGFDLVAILLVAGLVATRYGPGVEAVLAAAVWALHPTFVRVALNGLETSVAASLALAVLLVYRARPPTVGRAALLGLLLGIAVLARIDALLLCAVVGLAVLRDAPGGLRRRVAQGATVTGVAVAVYAPFALWSLHWTGRLFPISGEAVRLNALSSPPREALGALFWARSAGSALGSIVWHNGPLLFGALVVGLAWAFRSRGRSPAGRGARILRELGRWDLELRLAAALYLAYSFWVLAWWFNHRYLFLVTLLPILGLAALASTLGAVGRRRLLAAVVLACLLHPRHLGVQSGAPDDQLGYRNIGLWTAQRFAPGDRVGACQSGAIHYYAPGVDVRNLDGVVSPAALAALQERRALAWVKGEGLTHVVGWRSCRRYLTARSGPGQGSLHEVQTVPGFRSWRGRWRVFEVR